jgi:type IV pilus biogenesis protein CpaD/CtpE
MARGVGWRHHGLFINHQINNPSMKKIIVSCLAVVALAFISGCASDETHSKTTTSQQTTTPGPTTTTTTDTQTK